MKKRLLAIFLVLGLVLTQAPALSALAEDSPSEEPLVTVEAENPVEDSSVNGSDDIPALSFADDGEVFEEAAQEEPVITSEDSAEPVFLGEPADGGGTRGATGQYGIYNYVTGEGMVKAFVDGAEVGWADPGDDVILVITPAAGWEFNDLKVTNSDLEEQRIFSQPDGTYLFWMPNSSAYVNVTFTKSSTDPETSFFGVLITDADGNGNASGSRYEMFYPGMEGESSRTSASNNFVENGDGVFLQAYPADGYKFLGWYQGDPDKADGKLYTGEPLTTSRLYEFTAPISLARPYVCAVFDVDDSPQADQVQMWVGNIVATPGGASAQGGKVAVQYTPSYDVYPDIKAKDGTDFVYGDVLQFYKGDKCTVYQQPDPGYRFVGWYHANGENIGGLFYEGDPISTEDTFTYKPGKTIVPGDTEPLRYVCAVFEEEEAATVYLCTGRSDGGTFKVQTGDVIYDDAQMNNMALDGGAQVALTATPADGYEFAGYYEGIRQMEPGQDGYGFVTDYDPDKLISAEGNYSFTIAENTNIYALFREKPATVTVTFDAQGGTPEPAAQTFASGGKPTKPADPSREGWGFRGWYTDKVYTEDNKFDFDTPVTEDMTLYAGWAKVHMLIPYDITKMDSGGGAISYDGSDPVAGGIIIVTAFDGETHTLAATPNEGYEFVGWSTSLSEDGIISTDAEYTYESRDATDWFALFREKPATVTVTFDAQGGTPVPEPQTFASSGKPTEPAEPEKAGWDFGGWCTDSSCTLDSRYFQGDTDDPITSDITLYARWQKSITLQTHDLTNASGDAGGSIAYRTCDADCAGAALAYFSIVEGDNVKFTGTPGEGYEFVGWSTSTSEDGIVSDANPYEFTVAVDSSSTLYALFEEVPPTLTLHWSSVDGVDLEDPIEIEYTPGMTLDDALEAAGYSGESLFTKDGYLYAGYITLKPVNDFEDEEDFYEGCISLSYKLNDETDIYVVMFKELKAAEITIEAPVCGSTEAPAVSLGSDGYDFDENGEPRWVEDADTLEPYVDELVGGNEYLAYVRLAADFRYYFADDAQITVNGGTLESAKITFDDRAHIIAKVAVEHNPAEPVEENRIEPTCTEAGSYDEVIYCTGCDEEISRETKEIPALGHDWGEWIVDIEATEEEEGLRHRECNRCGEMEEEVIPMIVAEYTVVSGDGSTYTKGSSDPLVFTFKRTVNDAVTFANFQRIEIDGKEVARDNYTVEEGSIIITVKPEFLATLENGAHTLTAFFENGKSATATFTVKAKEAAPSDDSKDAPPNAVKTGDQSQPWLFVGIASASLLCIALTILIYRRRNTDR